MGGEIGAKTPLAEAAGHRRGSSAGREGHGKTRVETACLSGRLS